MEKSTKWVLAGCGIGCGLVILLLAAAGAGGFLFVRNMVTEFEEAEGIAEIVRERYGDRTDFVPEPDGTIPAERVEAFLAVREIMGPARERMEATLTTLGGGDGSSAWSKMRAGFELMPQIAGFTGERNAAFLEGGMGPGEYTYIYAMAYYGLLGKPPGDGPPFEVWDSESHDHGPEFGGWGRFDPEDRLESVTRRLNEDFLPVLRNQLARIEGGGVQVPRAWRRALENEVAAMEEDRYRVPWAGGLPEALEASLEPYRTRLEESYRPMCNLFEVALDQN